MNNNYVSINNEGIKKSDLIPYIKQTPNKQIFGSKFHLGLYNLSDLEKEKWPHNWLRNIGEEPVIFDPSSTVKSNDQIRSYISSKGYFDSEVTDTVQTANQKSDVFYTVDLKKPYTVRKIYYEVADTTIRKLAYFDSTECLIERGKPYDVDIIQAERNRFEKFVKDHGFFEFSGDHIYFRIDSTVGNRQVDIYYCVKKALELDESGKQQEYQHSIYRVKNIYIYPDFVPKNALEEGSAYLNSLDTTFYNGYYFISSSDKPHVKYDIIIQSLYLKPESTFNISNTDQSQKHLLGLKVYRLVNIIYQPRPVSRSDSVRFLDCNIQMTPLSQQSYKIELEGTNSAGNLGGAVNLIYQHKNLFHGAELFTMKLKGAYEALAQQNTDLRSSQEYGAESGLRIPRFLLPFINKESFVKKYNPTTNILAAYNYQNLPVYTRTMANATFGYDWRSTSYSEHVINPLQFNVVKLLSIDSAYQAQIEASSYLAYSYKDVMILGGNYSYIFNNQKINRSRDFWFLRLNAEAAGNMLALVKKISNAPETDGVYDFLRQPFAQYIRVDGDIRYNFRFNDASSVVYRGFAGVGIPYGNSKAIPFEKQYFGGGANGIRAWQVRTLGPGSFNPADTVSFLNQTADIKIEANAEYRFKLFWILEGALFFDAGNIWTVKEDDARPGAQFKFNQFYKDFALGTGLGFRFDLQFVIGRIDVGMKLRDPSLSDGSKWIFMQRGYNFRDDFAMVIGIGYPF